MSYDFECIQIIPDISKESSGPSYSVVKLAENLIDLDLKITLATLDIGLPKKPPDFLYTFPLSYNLKKLGASSKMKEWLKMKSLIGKKKIFHNHGMWQNNSLYASLANKLSESIYVSSPRGAFSEWAMKNGSRLKKIYWPLMQKPSLKNVTCFHATAYSEYLDIRRLGFKQPVTIIPNGVGIPIKKIDNQVDSKKSKNMKLLFLGRIHKKKGLEMLLNSWKTVQNEFTNWELYIVGNDMEYDKTTGYLKYLKSLSKKLKTERVFFLGEKTSDEKFEIYQNCDLFVLPTYSENFGMTVAESLAASTPVIVSKGAPWNEIEIKKAGWWIDINENALTECFRRAFKVKPEKLKEMGVNGNKWMNNYFSWNSVAKKMLNTYTWLNDRHSKKPDHIITD
jgi:glycosyltransferase involved in cell wall biosynthesis